jgi:hypothetical protein
MCTLPGTGTITGTVVIDRPGVRLDCQNRIIQPPRFAGSNQQCVEDYQCGEHGSGSPIHRCINGFCQLGNLAGINVGGPEGVDDGMININVGATGFIQDVTVANCIVRNFAIGYSARGDWGGNGTDYLDLVNSEFRSNNVGIEFSATDGSLVSGNWSHHNDEEGMEFYYNWSAEIAINTFAFNVYRQMIIGGYGPNTLTRWLNVRGNTFQTNPPNSISHQAIYVSELQATAEGVCNGVIPASLCDMYFDSNRVKADNGESGVAFFGDPGLPVGTPTVALRNNTFDNTSIRYHVGVSDDISIRPRCWNKGNLCSRNGSPVACSASYLFAPGDCWY